MRMQSIRWAMAAILAAGNCLCHADGEPTTTPAPIQDAPPKDGVVAMAADREWTLTPECRLDGDTLTVVVPKEAAAGQHGAWTTVDLAPFAEDGFEATVRVRGENVSVPPERYNGVKFMFHLRNGAGADEWPGAWLPTGTFDWRTAFIDYGKTANIEGRLDHFDKVVLPLAQKYGLMVVLDLHVPPGGRDAGLEANMFYDERFANHFVELWRGIAKRFKGREGIYGYDLINEPCQRREASPGCDWWSLQRRAAEAIRAEDPQIPIIVESNQWDSPGSFRYFSPLTLTNVIYEVHLYAPDDFTHQRVLGTRPWTVTWPNAEKGWDKEYLRKVLKPVRDFQLKHGAHIYVGEFSAICWAPGAENYLRDCIEVFQEYGWDWTYHAFREWAGWSVEHEGGDDASLRPSADNPRKQALLEGFRK